VVARPEPFISFLVTAYKTESIVGETIRSVLDQTRTDWELIVVDNGNSDEMARVVRTFTDPRITLLRQDNHGLRGGVDTAARAATGRYMCVLSSDDLMDPDFCRRVHQLVEADPGIEAVACDAELFHSPETRLPSKGWFESIGWRSVPDPSHTVSLFEMLEDGVPLYIGAFRRDVWDAHGGYDPATTDVEPDIELWLRMAAAGCDIRIIRDKLARIRQRPDSESREPSRVESFETRYRQAFLGVCKYHPISEEAVLNGGVMRRLRYHQALRRARWALLEGDVQGARAAALEAYRVRRTAHAAVISVAMQLSPTMLRTIHPAKNRAQAALTRVRSRITSGLVS
jgi:glycosyltransferase involved in cell wall biosynthesis